MMEARAVTICRANSDYVVGFSRGVAIAFWRFHTKAEYVSELEATALRAHKACGERIALMQVVAGSAITPDGRARGALAQMLRSLNGIVSHSAIVHEAEGFRAAMIRSIVTGVAALSNPGFPHRVFAEVPEAAGWMSEGNERLNIVHIVSSVDRLRRQIPAAREGMRPMLDEVPRFH
jgi:hypothetical protein